VGNQKSGVFREVSQDCRLLEMIWRVGDFSDEPTSYWTAHYAIISATELADVGKTVVAVIHQPSQYVFAKFDDLILLSEAKTNVQWRAWIVSAQARQGYPAPNEVGTAEHLLTLARQRIAEQLSTSEWKYRQQRRVQNTIWAKHTVHRRVGRTRQRDASCRFFNAFRCSRGLQYHACQISVNKTACCDATRSHLRR
jgi:hypothetical protein